MLLKAKIMHASRYVYSVNPAEYFVLMLTPMLTLTLFLFR